jgi:CyaY protein
VALTEAEYERRAQPELLALVHALDAIDSDALEAELSSDILSLEFSDGAKYVLNSHRAARQIWMAAERAAWHFDWQPQLEQWVAQKTGDELWSTLARILSEKLAKPIALARHLT